MEDEETTILVEKSTILNGSRCRRRRRDVELKPPQPPSSGGFGLGLGLRAELGNKIKNFGQVMHSSRKSDTFTYFANFFLF